MVLDPRTRESRGFGFVTMEHLDDAERCIKYLNRSTLEGRMITVEKVRDYKGATYNTLFRKYEMKKISILLCMLVVCMQLLVLSQVLLMSTFF